MGKKIWIILIVVFLLIASVGAYVYVSYVAEDNSSGSFESSGGSGSSGGSVGVYIPPPVLTKETLPAYFEKQALVQALPDDAVIALDFFDVVNGEWVVDNSYTLKRGSVAAGEATNPDLIITVNSKYLPEFGDFCGAIKKAKAKGDISFDMKLSTAAMMWKYKSVMKYRECFGF
ncbi:MAG: hypothetical protein WCP89_03395 [archaeon]